ncbi:hypothetical protein N7470_004810 [Penicillium chermesinum]|nr:hypothetical protein N7470_004810 [Penicillium chermesinum]
MGSLAVEIPLGTDEAMNAEITAIWVEMQKRVAKLAQLAGGEVDPNLQVGSILNNLDVAANPKKKHPKASARVRKIFDNTLTVISNVGGIVADGASQVFGPAGQCYNAINFLIGAYKGYQSSFDDLADLFEKCTKFLKRLEEYSAGKMDAKLTMVVYQHLDLFVQICDRAYGLRAQVRPRFKLFAKSAFLSSNGMEDLTSQMESLIDEERGLVGAQTFKYASLTHGNTEIILEKTDQMDGKLDVLVEDSSANKNKREKDNDKRALLHILSYDKTSAAWDHNTQKPTDSWEISYNNIRRNHVENTGDWLFSNPEFKAWANTTSKSPVIGLVGSEASGKSYLTSTIIRHLRNNPVTEQPDARQLVGFYWMGNGQVDIGDISRALVWQYAEDDDSYLQTVAAKCKQIRSLDPKDILPTLLLDPKVLEKVDATFYIVINKLGGYAESVDPVLLSFLQRIWRSQYNNVRILFTATPSIAEHLGTKGLFCPIISISEHNHDDIRKFISARMEGMESLSDKRNPKVREIREEIVDKLCNQTKGDYIKVDLALSTIGSLDDVDEIRRVLENAGNPLIDNIRTEIDTLAKTRTAKELQEINDIILWLEYGQRSLSINEMSKFLEWKSKTVSVRSLLSKFKGKYSLFEVDTDGMVSYKSSKVHEAIRQRDEIATTEQESDKKVTASEIHVLKHFLDKMCPPSCSISSTSRPTWIKRSIRRKCTSSKRTQRPRMPSSLYTA